MMENILMFFVPDCGSPVAILQGDINDDAINMTAGMTAAYSDAAEGEIIVLFGKHEGSLISMKAMKSEKSSFAKYLI